MCLRHVKVEKLRFSKLCRSFGTSEVSAYAEVKCFASQNGDVCASHKLAWKSFAFLQYLNGAYRLSVFYMAIYVTVRAVHTERSIYARQARSLQSTIERVLIRQSLSPTTS